MKINFQVGQPNGNHWSSIIDWFLARAEKGFHGIPFLAHELVFPSCLLIVACSLTDSCLYLLGLTTNLRTYLIFIQVGSVDSWLSSQTNFWQDLVFLSSYLSCQQTRTWTSALHHNSPNNGWHFPCVLLGMACCRYDTGINFRQFQVFFGESP